MKSILIIYSIYFLCNIFRMLWLQRVVHINFIKELFYVLIFVSHLWNLMWTLQLQHISGYVWAGLGVEGSRKSHPHAAGAAAPLESTRLDRVEEVSHGGRWLGRKRRTQKKNEADWAQNLQEGEPGYFHLRENSAMMAATEIWGNF